MKDNYLIIFVTAKDKTEAEQVSQSLLKDKIIACANLVSPITSFFNWGGKIDKAEECLIIMKSRADLFDQIVRQVNSIHSYEVPEILAFPIVEGSKSYLEWMEAVLKPKSNS